MGANIEKQLNEEDNGIASEASGIEKETIQDNENAIGIEVEIPLENEHNEGTQNGGSNVEMVSYEHTNHVGTENGTDIKVEVVPHENEHNEENRNVIKRRIETVPNENEHKREAQNETENKAETVPLRDENVAEEEEEERPKSVRELMRFFDKPFESRTRSKSVTDSTVSKSRVRFEAQGELVRARAKTFQDLSTEEPERNSNETGFWSRALNAFRKSRTVSAESPATDEVVCMQRSESQYSHLSDDVFDTNDGGLPDDETNSKHDNDTKTDSETGVSVLDTFFTKFRSWAKERENKAKPSEIVNEELKRRPRAYTAPPDFCDGGDGTLEPSEVGI